MRDSPLSPGDMQEEAPVAWRWIETALLTLALPVVRFALGSKDPFGLAWEFPWLVFVPLAIGVQHGLSCGVASVIALAGGAGWYASWAGTSLPPASTAFACGAIALGASRACDALRERSERLREQVVRLELACERERRAREVLRLSHDTLVQQLAGAPASADQVLASAVRRVAEVRSVREFSRCVLEVLVHHAELQEGSVWLEAHGSMLRIGATRGGEGGRAKPGPRAMRAMQTGSVVASSDGPHSMAEAAVPLIAADGKVRGVVMVDQLTFDARVPGAFQRMLVLVSGLAAPVETSTWERWVTESELISPNERVPSQNAGVGVWDAIA